MSSKLFSILTIIVLNLFKVSNALYSEPDLETTYVASKWRDICGLLYVPEKISFRPKCFKHSPGDIALPNPITSYRRTKSRVTARVFQGQDVQPRESPWTVQIAKKRRYNRLTAQWEYLQHCTGVILTPKHILTAAHCHLEQTGQLVLFLGNDRPFKGLMIEGITIRQHDRFVKHVFPNGTKEVDEDFDIGMITLDRAIDWFLIPEHGIKKGTEKLMITTICLPKIETWVTQGIQFGNSYQKATLFGWGLSKDLDYPKFLQRGDVSVQYNSLTNKTRFNFSADANQTRPCRGDTGAGLVQYVDETETRAVLIGILNFINVKIAGTNDPPCNDVHMGMATANRVVRLLPWIRDNIDI